MFNLDYWQQRAARQTFISTALIDGHPVGALCGATFDTINPATNRVLAQVAACGAAEVDLAVRS
ncbi:MAG: aldehyde dehydrogenase PuuC, partial [Pseudomonas sp.]|nr:aldehyde dehydrogenase PuuC [Pseudomonas sp.]